MSHLLTLNSDCNWLGQRAADHLQNRSDTVPVSAICQSYGTYHVSFWEEDTGWLEQEGRVVSECCSLPADILPVHQKRECPIDSHLGAV